MDKSVPPTLDTCVAHAEVEVEVEVDRDDDDEDLPKLRSEGKLKNVPALEELGEEDGEEEGGDVGAIDGAADD